MDAVYRLFDPKGQCYELRGDTEKTCADLIRSARRWVADIVDLCGIDNNGEIRATTSDSGEDTSKVVETEYLKKGEVFKRIPITIPVSQKFTAEMMKKLCKGLEELQEDDQVTTEGPEEKGEQITELPLVEVPKDEECLMAEQEEPVQEDETIRPIVEIRVITAMKESRDFSTLFG